MATSPIIKVSRKGNLMAIFVVSLNSDSRVIDSFSTATVPTYDYSSPYPADTPYQLIFPRLPLKRKPCSFYCILNKVG